MEERRQKSWWIYYLFERPIKTKGGRRMFYSIISRVKFDKMDYQLSQPKRNGFFTLCYFECSHEIHKLIENCDEGISRLRLSRDGFQSRFGVIIKKHFQLNSQKEILKKGDSAIKIFFEKKNDLFKILKCDEFEDQTKNTHHALIHPETYNYISGMIEKYTGFNFLLSYYTKHFWKAYFNISIQPNVIVIDDEIDLIPEKDQSTSSNRKRRKRPKGNRELRRLIKNMRSM